MTGAQPLRGLVEALIRSDFNRFHGMWVEEHLRLMVALRATFGNDLDKIIILAAIGQQQLRDPTLSRRPYAPDATAAPSGNPARFTNVDGLAAATGIPRESVRRKVNELIAVGWVVRIGSRRLAIHPRAAVDLEPSTRIVFDMLDRLFAEFAAGLAERGMVRIERDGSEAVPAAPETPPAGS